MKKLNISLLLILLVQIVVISFILLNPQKITRQITKETEWYSSAKTERDLEVQAYSNLEDEEPNSSLFTSGWIPDWGIPDGFNTLKSQKDNFDGISPVWFWVNEDGSLLVTPYANDPEFVIYTRENNIELIPTITLFDAEIFSKVLNDEEHLRRHKEEIMLNVVQNDYAGIDLDYESIYLKDREEFFEFLKDLKEILDEYDKKLVFTVLPKWGNTFNYIGLPQTRIVQDYSKIAEIVDEFRIMTYELSGRNAEKIGPIAPIAWVEQVIQYTIAAGVPRDKILLGIHTYGYDYPAREIETEIFDPGANNFKWFRSVDPYGTGAVFPEDVVNLLQNYDMKEEYNAEWEEAIGRYVYEGKERIVIYPTQASIDARKQLAKKYGLKGVVYWRIGDDGNLQY